MSESRPLSVWVIDSRSDDGTFERLGDARQAADRLKARVGVLLLLPAPTHDKSPGGASNATEAERLIQHGADHVTITEVDSDSGACTRLAAARRVLAGHRPRLVIAPGDGPGREWAAMLALELGARLVSPALLINARDGMIDITGLHPTDGLARRVKLAAEESAVITLRNGVGEALPADPTRRGEIERLHVAEQEAVTVERSLPADPATVDIRFANRLVAGGRGLGGKEGFDALRSFAAKLGAGVAASRMAVDLGWIEHERQVGQTGKTVKPDLYIACGISGASHHLEGMADAKHIVAINTDPAAPIFKTAHLGLVADLFDVLKLADEGMKP